MTGRDEHSPAEEFDRVARRAGLTVPAEWRAGTVAAYTELMAFTELLREPGRPVGNEPSAVYRILVGDEGV
ncbi:hypothetical protein GT045_22380 [Streptomyces sp. SID486]|uniref:hypothetical protein n=1 Tax=unclassified Streptomyces TaxID=2593676 RepID=UPI00136E0787|nr:MULTISPECIES: hypothetical protein [unclassified Streptomyces]MYW14573.1 hypothetical protein [Streptomyces sp. SID2955]MYW45707.1 hypothetical protein [Streptomyces sp. SID161]MYX97485.1 hypothetical protein [Streptomyces sp. SID486]